MNVSLNSVPLNPINFNARELIFKPLVYLILSVVIPIFAVLFVAAVFDRLRRTYIALSPPSDRPQQSAQNVRTWAQPSPSVRPQQSAQNVRGEVQPPQRNVRRLDYISLGRFNLIQRDYTLDLTAAREQQLLNGDISFMQELAMVTQRVMNDHYVLNLRVENGPACDAGGPQRQYFSFLSKSLKQYAINGGNGDLVVDPLTNLLIPQSAPVSDYHRTIFYDIGTVMVHILHNHRQPFFGSIFDDSIYAAILCLSDSEIDGTYDQLSDETKLRMCEIYLRVQESVRGKDFKTEMAVIDFLKKKGPLTEQMLASEDLKRARGFYEVVAYQNGDDRFATEGELNSTLNVEAIMRDQEGFRRQLFDHFLQNKVEGLWTIGSVLFPVHTMAKAMKAVGGNTRWRGLKDRYTASAPGCTAPSYVLAGRNLRLRVQGSLDRQEITNQMKFAGYLPDPEMKKIVDDQVQWIKDWILDPNTSDEKVEALLIFWTGSSHIGNDQINIYSGGKVLLPSAGTCGKSLTVSSNRSDPSDPCPQHNRDKEGYFKVLEELIQNCSLFTHG